MYGIGLAASSSKNEIKYLSNRINFKNGNYLVNIPVSQLDFPFTMQECIENLKSIKQYEDLISDKARYDSMTEEKKKFEESKFHEKDRIVRAEIKLFNVSLKFLVSLTKLLQTFFINNDFITNLAGFLNYSLNVFASPLGNELKLKNLNDYNFNPNTISIDRCIAEIIAIKKVFTECKINLCFYLIIKTLI